MFPVRDTVIDSVSERVSEGIGLTVVDNDAVRLREKVPVRDLVQDGEVLNV